ncbi:MAG: hypothetical protein GXO76_02495 [Calditrichaeota bacterium]|nr:hypothetical protein [Calditrichota bacterium]
MKRFLKPALFFYLFNLFLPAAFSQGTTQILNFSPSPKGFIQTWLVRGPFLKKSAADDTTDFLLPEGSSHRVYSMQSIGNVVSDSIQKDNPKVWHMFLSSDYKVNFRDVFFPNQNTVAYAATWIYSPKKERILLKFGSDDGIAIWVNGKQIASVPVYRGLQVDNNVAPVTLKKGLNFMLVRVFQGVGGWEFCARLTRPDGAPLKDVTLRIPGHVSRRRILSLKAKAISTQTLLLPQNHQLVWEITVSSHSTLSMGPSALPVRVTLETADSRVLSTVFDGRLPVDRERHVTRIIDPSKLQGLKMTHQERNLPETKDAIFFLHTQIFSPTKKVLREQRTPIYYY